MNDEITSPIGAQIFEFCEPELFPVQNSEAASTSNCGGYEEEPTPLSITTPATDATGGGPPSPSAADARNNSNNLAMLMDDQTVDDISIDFNLSPSSFSVPHDQQYSSNQDPFAMSSIHNQIQLLGDAAAAAAEGSLYATHLYNPDQQQQQPDCLQPSYNNIRLRSSSTACTLSDPMVGPYNLPSSDVIAPFPFDNSWQFLTGGVGTDFSQQELESQGDNGGFYLSDSLARVLNSSGGGDLQTLSSSESQQLLNGSSSTALASEISSLEDPTFKVGKLSAEERKRKIHRYLKKRNERNFSKKIKYACRKTLADSRPRVRGRFAKNDELGELPRNAGIGNNQDDDVDEFMPDHNHHHHHHQKFQAAKGEDGMDPSELFAHINEVNSFKCDYPIQSWI